MHIARLVIGERKYDAISADIRTSGIDWGTDIYTVSH